MSIFDGISNAIKDATNAVSTAAKKAANVVVDTVQSVVHTATDMINTAVLVVTTIVENPVSAFSTFISTLNVFTRLDWYPEKFKNASAAELNSYAGDFKWTSLSTASSDELVDWLSRHSDQAVQLNAAWAYITPSMIASLNVSTQVAMTDVALMAWLTSSSAPFAVGWDDIKQSLSHTVAPLSNKAFAMLTISDLNAIAQLDGRFTGLSSTQLQAWLAVNSIQKLPTSVLKFLTAEIFNSLSVLQIGQISATQLGQINVAQFGLLKYQTINSFSKVALTGMTVAQLQNISTKVFGELSTTFLNNMPATLLPSVLSLQLGALSPAAFSTLDITMLLQLMHASSGITGHQILAWLTVDGHAVKQLGVELFSHLSPAALSGFTVNLVSTITLDQFKSLKDLQVGAFGSAFSGMTPDNLKALSKAQSAGITGTEIKSLSSAQFTYFSVRAISGLSNDAVSTISASQISVLLLDRIVAFGSTFGFLQNEALAMLSISQWSVVTEEEIQSLSTVTLAGFTPATVGKITSAQIPFFSVEQIGAFGVAFAGMSNEDVLTLNTSQIAAVTSTEIGALTKTQIPCLNSTILGGLSSSAVQGFTATEIKLFSPAQVEYLGLNFGALSDAAIQTLNAAQIKALTASELSTLSYGESKLLSADFLNSLTPMQLRGFGSNQMAALSIDQIAAFSSAQLMNLSSSQVACISNQTFSQITALQVAGLSNDALFGLTFSQLALLAENHMVTAHIISCIDQSMLLNAPKELLTRIDASALIVLDPMILSQLKPRLSSAQISILTLSKAGRVLNQQASSFTPATLWTLSQLTKQLTGVYSDLNSFIAPLLSIPKDDATGVPTKESDASTWLNDAMVNTTKTGYKHQTYSRIMNDAWRDMVDMNLKSIKNSDLSVQDKNSLTVKLESLKANSQALLLSRVGSMLSLIAVAIGMLSTLNKNSTNTTFDNAKRIMPLVAMITSGLQTIASSSIKSILTDTKADFTNWPTKSITISGEKVGLKYIVAFDPRGNTLSINNSTNRTQALNPFKQAMVQTPFLIADAMGIACDILNIIYATKRTDKLSKSASALSLISDVSFLVADILPIFTEAYSPVASETVPSNIVNLQQSLKNTIAERTALSASDSAAEAANLDIKIKILTGDLETASAGSRIAGGINIAARAALIIGAVVGMAATLVSAVITFKSLENDKTLSSSARDAAIGFASVSLALNAVMIVGSFFAPILAPIGLVLTIVLLFTESIYNLVERNKAQQAASDIKYAGMKEEYNILAAMVNGDVDFAFNTPAEHGEPINSNGWILIANPTHWTLDKTMLLAEGDIEYKHNNSIFMETPNIVKIKYKDPVPATTYTMSFIETWVMLFVRQGGNISEKMTSIINLYNGSDKNESQYKIAVYFAWRGDLIRDRIMSQFDDRASLNRDYSKTLGVALGRVAFGLSKIANQVFYTSIVSMQNIFLSGFYIPIDAFAIGGRTPRAITAGTVNYGSTQSIVPINSQEIMGVIDGAGTWNAKGNGRYIVELTNPTESNGATFTVRDIWDFFSGKLVHTTTADHPNATMFDAAFIVTGGEVDNADASGVFTISPEVSKNHTFLWELIAGGNFEMHTSSADSNEFFDATDNKTKVTIYGSSNDSLKVQDGSADDTPHVVMLCSNDGNLSSLENAVEIKLNKAGRQAVKVLGLNNLLGATTSATILYDRGIPFNITNIEGTIVQVPDYLYIYNDKSMAYGGQCTVLVATGGGTLIGGAGYANQFLINSGNVTAFGSATAWQEVVLSAFGSDHDTESERLGTAANSLKKMVIDETLKGASPKNYYANSVDNNIAQTATYKVTVQHENASVETYSGTLFNMDGYNLGGGDNTVKIRSDGSIVRVNNTVLDAKTNSAYSLFGNSQTVQTSWGNASIDVWGKDAEIVTGRGYDKIVFHPRDLNSAIDSGHAILLMGTGTSDIDVHNTNIVVNVSLTTGIVNISEGSGDTIVTENLASVQANGGHRYVNGKLYQPKDKETVPPSTFSDNELTIHLDPSVDSNGNWTDMGTTQFNLQNFYLTSGNTIKVIADRVGTTMVGFEVVAQTADGSRIAGLAHIDFNKHFVDINSAAKMMSNLYFQFDDKSFASVNLAQVVSQPNGFLVSSSM